MNSFLKNKFKIAGIVLITFTILILANCKKNNDSGASYGGMIVRMTDSPAAYNKVNVEIVNVSFHYSDTKFGSDSWVTLDTKTGIYDLVKFQNIMIIIADNAHLAPGKVTQVRLILGTHNSVELKDGSVQPLRTPGGTETGIKLNVDSEIPAGKDLNIILDFNAEESVQWTSGTYLLSPVIRVKNIYTE